MPRISFFYGISIWMYWNEGVHARPHLHARYGGEAASIDFAEELNRPPPGCDSHSTRPLEAAVKLGPGTCSGAAA